MFSRNQAANTRSRFFTSLGKYMAPIPAAGGEKISWMNYRTGVRSMFLRIETPDSGVEVGFLIQHNDQEIRLGQFNRLLGLQALFSELVGSGWTWSKQFSSGEGHIVSRVYDRFEGVSILHENDWPEMISFIKPRLIALDNFWWQIKDQYLD